MFGFWRLLIVCLFWWGSLTVAYSSTSCVSIPPVATLELPPMYSDPKGSIIDQTAEDAKARIMKPIYTFFQTVEHALDGQNAGPGNSESDCAFKLFGQWAKADALTFEPSVYNSEGKIARGLINPGFQMIGIKFRSSGYILDDTMLRWLRNMNRKNVDFYTKGTNRSNQRVWAAAGAALNSVLEPDPQTIAFQNRVWHEALTAIDGRGFIAAELGRGQQALVYHMYSFSATLVLVAARNALGYEMSAEEKQDIQRLADAIGRTLCNPDEMALLAGTKLKIPNGQWAYRVINGLGVGYLDADWSRCGLPPLDYNARDIGGDSRRSAAILKGLWH